jgi:hypothetical protein
MLIHDHLGTQDACAVETLHRKELMRDSSYISVGRTRNTGTTPVSSGQIMTLNSQRANTICSFPSASGEKPENTKPLSPHVFTHHELFILSMRSNTI